MLISYSEYQEAGGTLDEAAFTRLEPIAEVFMNHWTLSRLKSSQVIVDLKNRGQWQAVQVALAGLVDRAEQIQNARTSKAKGETVTSFNNGVNSFSFASDASAVDSTAAEDEARSFVCQLLPVELISECVSYNEAH